MRFRISLALFVLCFKFSLFSHSQPQTPSEEVVEIVVLQDTLVQKVIQDITLYQEKWDTLAQMKFWRRVMKLTPDSSLLNIADTREILHVFPTMYYDTLTTEAKRAFKDSMLHRFKLPEDTRLYVTYGKSHFYQHKAVMQSINRGIEIFEQEGTDPWFAQAILLIESPGKLAQSPTGAYGSFQLMKSVAIQEGLTVNSKVDEREDFDKSAQAAARFIQRVCLPETRKILHARGIHFEEKDLWFRLLVLHVYHAGAGNVAGALRTFYPQKGGMELIQKLWSAEYRGFRNASQNYSQVALASFLELDEIIANECNIICPSENDG